VSASLDGPFAVEYSSRLLRNYRYATERMMRTLGGWLALTPELSAKLLMGRHVWDNAQHADLFGKRLPELRSAAQTSEPASPGFAAFMDALESPEAPDQTAERLVGVYRVLKPHLLATYERHLAGANSVYEPPTRRILARCIEDERRHVAAGETIARHLVGGGECAERAAAWQARLEALLASGNGVTGDELSAPGGAPVYARGDASDAEADEFIRLERLGGGWPIPDDLAAALRGAGDALVAGDAGALGRWLATGVAPAPGVETALARSRPSRSRVVACARLGAQRAVKLRLDGAAATVALATRWALTADGWRATFVELAPGEPVPAAPPGPTPPTAASGDPRRPA
jgi:hypothetical protein